MKVYFQLEVISSIVLIHMKFVGSEANNIKAEHHVPFSSIIPNFCSSISFSKFYALFNTGMCAVKKFVRKFRQLLWNKS